MFLFPYRPVSTLLSIVVLLLSPWGVETASGQLTLANSIRNRIEAGLERREIRAAGFPLRETDALVEFYSDRGFEPAWVHIEGPGLLVSSMMESLADAGYHGLDQENYRLEALRNLVSDIERRYDIVHLVDLDLLLTDAFLLYGTHLQRGRIDPESRVSRQSRAVIRALTAALDGQDIARALDSLAPRQTRYQKMTAQMARLMKMSDWPWPPISEGPSLETEAVGPRVAAVRSRLEMWGDVPPYTGERADSFDTEMESGVKKFQFRHGLEPDGVVGPSSIRALNATPAERRKQLAINMERWRWLPDTLGTTHIEANIAGFSVDVLEDGDVKQTHRAIVGLDYRQSPTFSADMKYLVFAPYWHVPPSIAARDEFPEIRENPNILIEKEMEIVDRSTNKEVDPKDVVWAELDEEEFNERYRIRQKPGPSNALGDVKFMFPNQYDVYLHDTPSRYLFQYASRSFSHGCIRIQNPLELAEFLLSDQREWNRRRMDEVIRGGEEVFVELTHPVPVYLVYLTAWVDTEGRLQFRDDIYERDQAIWSALTEPLPD